MNTNIRRIISKLLRELADKLDAGNTELTEEEALDIIGVIGHEVLSKAQACTYLNLSRTRFDYLVQDGVIPKGKKRKGFKELVWYKDDLIKVVKNRTKL